MATSQTTYVLNHQAYLKLILHAAKYPHKCVNGVLIGKATGAQVTIRDAIPILHNWSNLSSMMSVAVDLARIYAKSQGDEVVGYYQANEKLGDLTLSAAGEMTASHVKQGFPEAIALVVDVANVNSEDPSLTPYVSTPSGNSWKPHPSSFSPYSPFSLQYPQSPSRCLAVMQKPKHLHRKIGDFDEHLENVKVDWLRNGDCLDAEYRG